VESWTKKPKSEKQKSEEPISQEPKSQKLKYEKQKSGMGIDLFNYFLDINRAKATGEAALLKLI